jgi:hypothetical protein
LLDIGRDVKRPDRVQREPVFAGPVKELVTGPCIRGCLKSLKPVPVG